MHTHTHTMMTDAHSAAKTWCIPCSIFGACYTCNTSCQDRKENKPYLCKQVNIDMERIKTGNLQRFPFTNMLNRSIVRLKTSQCCLLKVAKSQPSIFYGKVRQIKLICSIRQRGGPEQQSCLLFQTECLRRQPPNLFSCQRSACRHGERRSRPPSEGRPGRHLHTPGK